jgi:ATP-binding cassette subfamily B protein
VAFTVYLGMLNWPMVALGWVINLFQRGSASLRRIGEILEVAPAIASPPAALTPARCSGEVEFRRLTFTYPAAVAPTLREISFRMPSGALVALVGRTGSGKSTLAALLPRAFDPPSGAVMLDGLDVRAYHLGWLREHIAWVPQETFLFSATVAENIAYGRPSASRDSIVQAAEIAGLEDDLRGFPDGLDTRVGERGITLSGGQRQRVAIARAVIRDAPVLILDDCLSSVDSQTEEKVLGGLREVMRRRTTLLISHRMSAVRDADLILVLEHGRLVERGRHDELLAMAGRYADLCRAQQLEEELEAS